VSALATDTPRPAWTPQADQIIQRCGPRRTGEALRAAGIAWWRTWTPERKGQGAC
jgi:hypothetical protein